MKDQQKRNPNPFLRGEIYKNNQKIFSIFTTNLFNFFFLSILIKYQIWGYKYSSHSHSFLTWISLWETLYSWQNSIIGGQYHRSHAQKFSRSLKLTFEISKNDWQFHLLPCYCCVVLLALSEIVGVVLGCNSTDCCG